MTDDPRPLRRLSDLRADYLYLDAEKWATASSIAEQYDSHIAALNTVKYYMRDCDRDMESGIFDLEVTIKGKPLLLKHDVFTEPLDDDNYKIITGRIASAVEQYLLASIEKLKAEFREVGVDPDS